MFLRNAWYVAGWGHEVEKTGLLARRLLDEPVVFYRSENGALVALEDRCAHRLAPLSLGRVEGDNLRCMYHGLKFAPSGACVEVPGQDTVQPQLKVRSYPVAERDKLIWIWMGDATRADITQIPQINEFADSEWRMTPGYLHFKANYLYVLDNLLDFSHLSYVHPGTVGGTDRIALARPKIERMDRGVRITRWMLDGPPAPFQAKIGGFTGNVDRWHFYDILLPGLMLMRSGVQAVGTGAREGVIKDALEFRPCNLVTPESKTTTHYFYGMPCKFLLENDAVHAQVFADLTTAFEEDRVIIEAQQRVIDMTPEPQMNATQSDAALGQFRWILDKAIAAEQSQTQSQK